MEVGQIVEHILSKDWLLILEIESDRIICRSKALDIVYLYPFEVRERKI